MDKKVIIVVDSATEQFGEVLPINSIITNKTNRFSYLLTGVAGATNTLQNLIDSDDVELLGGDLNAYQLTSQKGQANGYASLNASGKIPNAQIPELNFSAYLGDFTSLTNALADSGVQSANAGDWVTVTASGTTTVYIITSDNPTQASDFSIVSSPADVTSVNSQTGIVVLDTDDISEGTNKYATQAEKDKLANVPTDTNDELGKKISSNVSGITGASQITNAVAISQTDYDNIATPNTSTIYFITP